MRDVVDAGAEHERDRDRARGQQPEEILRGQVRGERPAVGRTVRALASHPLVFSLNKAEAIYDEMAAAHQRYLPERLLR